MFVPPASSSATGSGGGRRMTANAGPNATVYVTFMSGTATNNSFAISVANSAPAATAPATGPGTPAIVGATVACVAFVVIVAVVSILLYKRAQSKQAMKNVVTTSGPNTGTSARSDVASGAQV